MTLDVRRGGRSAIFGIAIALAGCAETITPAPLRINEIVADNEGVWVDETGETEDWIELVNVGEERIWLDEYALSDRRDDMIPLPSLPLGPGERVIFFADGEPEEGERHLPFKLSSAGERVFLRDFEGNLRDLVEWSALPADHAHARFPDGIGALQTCRYTSAERTNGLSCLPPPRAEIEVETFAPFEWPDPFPSPEGPLAITEIALRPAGFVELLNTSDRAVSPGDFSLRVAPQPPGAPAPTIADGAEIALGDADIAPHQRAVFAVSADQVSALEAAEHYEGVLTLFARSNGAVLARADFMAWPVGAVLARIASDHAPLAFCAGATPGEPNDTCAPIEPRAVPGRLRNLRALPDFDALAAGGTEIGLRSVKVIVDMQSGDAVHFLGSREWDLHYTFVREQIEHLPHLDRCDPEQNVEFRTRWGAFSRAQYEAVETRRYLLANLVEHAATGHRTIEFDTGDRISPAQIERAFFAITAHLWAPRDWVLRPLSTDQSVKLHAIEGRAPIVGYGAPLAGLVLQPLTPGIGYGVLRWVPASELARAALGPDVIVVTDDVPNDIQMVGGLITETFQTPLSHVNVLSRGRGTPNMALRGASSDPRLAPYFDTLVRLEVEEGSFQLRPADPAEAEAFWRSRRPTGPRVAPRLDTSVRSLRPLAEVGLDDLPSIGAKAAQLAELGRVVSTRAGCAGPIPVPRDAFAIPVVHSIEHFEASGARARLDELALDDAFRSDPLVRAAGLEEVRQRILAHPVEPALLAEVTDAVTARFGDERVRFRSSSNIEDLPTFNGAGLYTSISAELDDPERPIEDALRTVWASLWNQRAYDERELANVDQSASAMGVLVHLAHLGEAANGVGVSRNIFDPTRGDIYYFNLQIGEASVANPAPGVTTAELFYRFGRNPRVVHQSRSSLSRFDIATDAELDRMACTLAAIHGAFRPMLDPQAEDRWFAMDIEFKLTRDRELIVKQARPYSFGEAEIPVDCREF